MKLRFWLPPQNKPKDVEAAIRHYFEGSQSEHRQRAYEWTRTHWYLLGVRRLAVRTWPNTQVPSPNHIDESGQRRVRIEKTLGILQTEMGRIQSLDLGPHAERCNGISLDSFRQTALTNAMLTDFWDRWNSQPFRETLSYMLPAFGCCGIGAFEGAEYSGAIHGASILTIPPWELRPLPGDVISTDSVAGVAWSRWVDLGWLRKNYGETLRIPREGSEAYAKMRVQKAVSSSRVVSELAPGPKGGITGIGTAPPLLSAGSTIRGDTLDGEPLTEHVELRQCWIYGDDYSCLRFSVMLGDHLAGDIDYTDAAERDKLGLTTLPVAPVHMARYLALGDFWGRGKAEQEIPLNRELELAVGDLLQANRDAANLTAMTTPLTSNVNLNTLKQAGRNKLIPYQPDYTATTLRPEIVSPPTELNRIMGQTIGLVGGLMNDVAMQSPGYSGGAPGRVDSEGGLALIAEQQNVPFLPIANSIQAAMVGTWKCVLGIMNRNVAAKELPIRTLTEDMLGVVLNPKTGAIQVPAENLPDPLYQKITIRSKVPVSKAAIKATLRENLQTGLISPVDYRILAHTHGVDDGCILNKTEFFQWQTAWRDGIILLGDLQTPGDVAPDALRTNHTIAMTVTRSIMAMPIFDSCSADVRQRFSEKLRFHEMAKGRTADALISTDNYGNMMPPSEMAVQLEAMGQPPTAGNTPLPQMIPGMGQ